MTPTTETILTRFAYHPATAETATRHHLVRTACTDLALVLNNLLPASREASLALTAVQEAMMWSNAAVAIHGAPPATVAQQDSPQPSLGQDDAVRRPPYLQEIA